MKIRAKKIFIVEDNAMNRIIFQIALGTKGAFVEFDRWGRMTLEKIADYQPDIIILDLMLPNGDSGYNIFEQIRQKEAYSAIPIVAISASEPSIAIPTTKSMGFSGFIAKPIDQDLLPKQISKILAGGQVWSAGGRYVSNDMVDKKSTS